jgi:hypothetical protein
VTRIRDIVADMTRITRLESATEWSANLPRMLEITGPSCLVV